MKLIVAAATACLLLSGCATKPEDIAPSYVSSTTYSNMSCKQLQAEAENVSAAAQQATGAQAKKAGSDAAMMGVGLIVFWPALFFLKGDGGNTATEVAQLKGQMTAIDAVNKQKNCGIRFSPR